MKKKNIISTLIIMVMLATASLSYAALQNRAFNAASMAAIELSEIDVMTSMLKSNDPFVRANTAQDLGELGDPEGTIPLIKALKDDNIYVRAYAAEALGKIKQSAAVEPLIAALNDEDEFVQSHIVQALGEIRDAKAVNPLVDLLNGKKQVVKTHAAWALGEIRDPKAVGALITALNDDECCDHAAEALKKITEQDFGTDHEQWNNWWLSTN